MKKEKELWWGMATVLRVQHFICCHLKMCVYRSECVFRSFLIFAAVCWFSNWIFDSQYKKTLCKQNHNNQSSRDAANQTNANSNRYNRKLCTFLVAISSYATNCVDLTIPLPHRNRFVLALFAIQNWKRRKSNLLTHANLASFFIGWCAWARCWTWVSSLGRAICFFDFQKFRHNSNKGRREEKTRARKKTDENKRKKKKERKRKRKKLSLYLRLLLFLYGPDTSSNQTVSFCFEQLCDFILLELFWVLVQSKTVSWLSLRQKWFSFTWKSVKNQNLNVYKADEEENFYL